MVVHTYHYSDKDAEAGGWRVKGQSGMTLYAPAHGRTRTTGTMKRKAVVLPFPFQKV